MPLAVEEDPAEDEDLLNDGEGDDKKQGQEGLAAQSPETTAGSTVSVEAPKEPESVDDGPGTDPLLPKSPKDWTTFWKVSVPGLGVENERAQQEAAKHRDAIAAYHALMVAKNATIMVAHSATIKASCQVP
jgi:hypothetical protein